MRVFSSSLLGACAMIELFDKDFSAFAGWLVAAAIVSICNIRLD